MNKLKFIIYPFMALFVLLSGCKKQVDPLDTEQYIKQVYLIGANQTQNVGGNALIQIPYSKLADEEQAAAITVATGGSKNIDRDISVVLDEAGNESIDRYNFLYLYKAADIKYRKLSAGLYRIPDKTVKIKAQEVYGTVPIYVKTASLHCDSLYAITVKLKSVSDPDYISIRKADTVLMMSFSMVNDYSASYQVLGSYARVGSTQAADTSTVSIFRTLKAVDYRTVRFYHLTNPENQANIPLYGISVSIGDDNTLTLSPWGTLLLTSGGGAYNPATKSFNLWYNYTVSGVSYQFRGTFKRNL